MGNYNSMRNRRSSNLKLLAGIIYFLAAICYRSERCIELHDINLRTIGNDFLMIAGIILILDVILRKKKTE